MVFGAISSFVSSGFSAVCSAVSSAVSSISSFAMTYGPKIGEALGKISPVFQAIAQAFGLIKPKENIEEIGDRAIQAGEAGIQLENYSKFDDYMTAIREFKLDPEKSKTISEASKTLAGIGIAGKGLEEKLNLPVDSSGILTLMIASNASFFNSDRVLTWLQSGQIPAILEYFDAKSSMGLKKQGDVLDAMIQLERQQDPSKTERTIYDEITEAKSNIS